MRIYSTCRDCGGLLHVTNNDTVHPLCEPKPTKAERLAEEFRAYAASAAYMTASEIETELNEYNNRPPRLLDAALTYARWGWPVFPIWPKGHKIAVDLDGVKIIANGKQPATPHGFKDATTSYNQIRAWWTKHPNCNIGLPTGHRFDVIDIDVPDGPISYTRMLEADIIPDVHGQVATSSGGLHLYIKSLGDEANNKRIMPGVDYKGIGGYVVSPPSTLGERGRAWSWITKPSPVITGVGDCFGATI